MQKKEKSRSKQKPAKEKAPSERRRSIRRQVLDTFQVFIVVPKKGLRRLYIKDLSATGVGFYADASDSFQEGEKVECDLYINPTLKVPLKIRIAHITAPAAAPEGASPEEQVGSPLLGCEFTEKSSRAYKAYAGFLHLLDELTSFLTD